MARPDALTAFPSAGAVLADGFPNHHRMETIMPQIGQFTRDGIPASSGASRRSRFDHDIIIVPAEPSDAENAPDYRVHDHVSARTIGPEIGAGWKRTGEKAGEYVALRDRRSVA